MRVSRAAVLAAFLVCPMPGATATHERSLLITGFAFDLPGSDGDDAIEILNPTRHEVELAGWALTDGEGTLRWPPGARIPAESRLVVALNGTSWHEAAGTAPDASVTGPGAVGMAATGRFLLARAGDDITLLRDGHVVDAVVYGSGPAAEGWIGEPVRIAGSPFLRWYARDGTVDTDTAEDWNRPRPAYVGAVGHEAKEFHVDTPVLAYSAPDASRATVRGFVQSAGHTLRINVYEFRDPQLAGDVADRAAAGVDVSVLVDAQPVGMGPHARVLRDGLLAHVQAAGADVYIAERGRLAYNHAKYAVADDRLVLVQTENFGRTGLPVDVAAGNRGWGVVVDDPSLAAWMAELFDSDTTPRPWSATRWEPDPTTPAQPPRLEDDAPTGTAAHPATLVAGPHRVRPVVSPDHTGGDDDPVVALLRSAQSSVRVNQLQFPPVWADAGGWRWEHAYMAALVDAAHRGVHVRVLLDGHFLDNPPASGGNAETAARLGELGLSNLEVRIWPAGSFGVLHAKGVVVDDEVTLVGSMNWNLNSVARNREVSLLIDSQGVAAHFAAVFDDDWDAAASGAHGLDLGHDEVLLIATVITAGTLLAALAVWRRT